MTNREFYTAIAASENLSEELVEYAAASLAKMDAANEKRKNSPSKKSVENAPLIEAILGVLTTEAQTASDIAEKCEISTQKASALLRQIVASGKAVSADTKVPKKGKVKAYSLAE